MQLQNKKKWLPWLLAAVMAPFAVGVWLVPYFHSRPGPGMSAAVRPVAPPARPAALPAPSPQKPATSNADAPTERQPLPLPNVPVAGNLGTITDLRAQLQEKQIRQALSEIDAKLAGAVPSSPGVAVLTPDHPGQIVGTLRAGNVRRRSVSVPPHGGVDPGRGRQAVRHAAQRRQTGHGAGGPEGGRRHRDGRQPGQGDDAKLARRGTPDV